MLPLPPRPTLLPYTTLFRSRDKPVQKPVQADEADQKSRGPDHRRDGGQPAERHGSGGCRRDRKSTRLNSSHVAISYAVFCLQKKRISTYFEHPAKQVTRVTH